MNIIRFSTPSTIFLSFFISSCFATSSAERLPAKETTNTSAPSATKKFEVDDSTKSKVIGTYKMIMNDIPELCVALEKNFNSFTREPPMTCKRKFKAELGFTVPDWKVVPENEIDWNILKQHFAEQNKKRQTPETMDYFWAKQREKLEASLRNGDDILWHAYFDVDNNGDIEHVYRFDYSKCDPSILPADLYRNASGYVSFVIDSKGHLDIAYRRLFVTNFDLFIYQGTTYGSHWEAIEEMQRSHILILQTGKPRKKFTYTEMNTCKFEYLLNGTTP